MIRKGRKPKGKLNMSNGVVLNSTRKVKKGPSSNISYASNTPDKNLEKSENNGFPQSFTEDYESGSLYENGENIEDFIEDLQGKNPVESNRPITRLKENQIVQQSGQKSPTTSSGEFKALKQFDDFYKNNKNIDNELYYYRSPRVSYKSFQIKVGPYAKVPKMDEYTNVINNAINNASSNNSYNSLRKKYDLLNLSEEDFNYYIKFINFYKEEYAVTNPSLKGGTMVEEMAMDLLKQCNYDINIALAKILFPSLEYQDPEIFSDPTRQDTLMYYVNSALNDLIGSNVYEKTQWLQYVKQRIENKIDLSELQNLLELAQKMKIDIPLFVVQEITNSITFSKLIRRHLNEKNNLKIIINLLEQSENYKVKTEEFYLISDIIKKTESWIVRASEIENKEISYKALQALYNDGRNLPVKLNNFDLIKKRYLRTQSWYEKYNSLPKHSKTRQQGSPGDRCTLSNLTQLLAETEDINFTSAEVVNLRINFELLKEYENRIMITLEDDLTVKTKELLTEFLNSLDDLKFTTSLYDLLMSKLEYFEWNEKKDYYLSNKVLKRKHLINLIKEANQKNLNGLNEIRSFKVLYEEIEAWLDKMSSIFYKENATQISIDELRALYDEGQKFDLQPEEVEHLFTKCDEVFEFIQECKAALSSQSFQYIKLSKLREQTIKYNVKCEEFEIIDSQIKFVHNWVFKSKKFLEKYISRKSEISIKFCDLTSIEDRQNNIDMLEIYYKKNTLFYENLIELIDNVPKFARASNEYDELFKIKTNTETEMDSGNLSPEYIENNMKLEEILNNLPEIYKSCVRRTIFINLISAYKAKSWSFIVTTLNNQISLTEAEALLREASNLVISPEDVNIIKDQVLKTKEWIKTYKKLSVERLNYLTLKKLIEESKVLPLKPAELDQLIQFNDELEVNIFIARSLLKEKRNETEISQFVNKIYDLSIEVPEFEALKLLKRLAEEWGNISKKIISSRILCELYFNQQDSKSRKGSLGNILNFFHKSSNTSNKSISNDISYNDDINPNPNANSMNNPNSNNNNYSNANDDSEDNYYKHSHDNHDINKLIGKKRMIKRSNKSLSSSLNNSGKKHFNKKSGKKFNKISFELPLASKDNINIKNNGNNFFQDSSIKANNSSSDKKSTKKEYENILSLINNNVSKKEFTPVKSSGSSYSGSQSMKKLKKSNQKCLGGNNGYNHNNNSFNSKFVSINKIPNKHDSQDDKLRLKKFNSLTFDEKIQLLDKILVLKFDNPDEVFCICRRGDDSVNYMIQCENCKEWFHGKCLKILQSQSQKISQYLCLVCSCRKENFTNSFHNEFFNYRRIIYTEFVNFIEEGDRIPVVLDNLEYLKEANNKIVNWIDRSKTVIRSVISNLEKIDTKKLKFGLIDDIIEKKLNDLYNESESFPVETEFSTTIILIFKQHDWFKEAAKCLESKKFSIKNAKKVLCNSSSIFTKEYTLNNSQSEVEQEYIHKVSSKEASLYNEILAIYDKFNIFMGKYQELKPNFKSEIDDIEEIIHQIEASDDLEDIMEEIRKYENWKNRFKIALNDPTHVSNEVFADLLLKSSEFSFKTTFLENFRKTAQNSQKEYNIKMYSGLIKEESSKSKKKLELPKDIYIERDINEDSEKDSSSIIKISIRPNKKGDPISPD